MMVRRYGVHEAQGELQEWAIKNDIEDFEVYEGKYVLSFRRAPKEKE